MKLRRHTFVPIALLLMLLPALAGCINDSYSDCAEAESAILVLRVAAPGHTRAGESVNELISSLRVVIVAENVVEFNEPIYSGEPLEICEKTIKITTGPKQIYLIANAENLTLYGPASTTASDFFDAFPVGSFGFEAAVNSLYFENSYYDTATAIPLTACYDIDARAGGQELDFWLVRAATKYSIHFENTRNMGVTLKELSIASLQDRMYLMPHVGPTQQTIGGYYWIDWLRQVADQSNEPGNATNPGNTEFNDRVGWITDYSVPVNSKKFTFTPISNASIEIPGEQTSSGENPEPGIKDLGPFYSTEGKALIDPDDPDGNQQYTLHLTLVDNKSGEQEITLSRVLPNLSALFRNTHVIINIGLSEGYMHIYAQIQNWETPPPYYGSATEEK